MNEDLLTMWIVFTEEISLGESGPQSRIRISVDVAQEDYKLFIAQGHKDPILQLKPNLEALSTRIPDIFAEIVLDSDGALQPISDSILRVEISQKTPIPLQEGRPTEGGQLDFYFAASDVFASFPISLAFYDKFQ